MRILHVSEVTTGGVAAVLRSVVPGQIAAGHEVTAVMPTRLDAVPADVHVPWGVRRQLRTLHCAVSEVRRVAEDVRPEAVHLHAFVAGCLGRSALLSATEPRRGPPGRLGSLETVAGHESALSHLERRQRLEQEG